MTKTKEIACLCGAREDDHGQQHPRKCWNCGKVEMRQGRANADRTAAHGNAL